MPGLWCIWAMFTLIHAALWLIASGTTNRPVPGSRNMDEKWSADVEEWLGKPEAASVESVRAAYVTASGLRLVAERREGTGADCTRRVERLDFTRGERWMVSVRTTPISTGPCELDAAARPLDWMLELLRDDIAGDTLTPLLPARGGVAVQRIAQAGSTRRKLATSSVTAASRAADGPIWDAACDLGEASLTCGDVGPKGFECECKHFGEQVRYAWKRAPSGFTLARVEHILEVPADAFSPAKGSPSSGAGSSIGVLAAWGTKPKDRIAEVMAGRATGIFYCASGGRPPSGDMVLWTRVFPDGTSSVVDAVRDTVRNADVRDCVEIKIRREWGERMDGSSAFVVRVVFTR